MRLQRVTKGYRGLQRVQGVSVGYRWLHGVTRGYRELQGVHLSLFIKGLQKGIRSLNLYIAGSVDCWICRSLDL